MTPKLIINEVVKGISNIMVNPNFEDPLVPEIGTEYVENKINILKQPSYGLNNMLFNYLYNILKKSNFFLSFFFCIC